jgi:hypothetical protein
MPDASRTTVPGADADPSLVPIELAQPWREQR